MTKTRRQSSKDQADVRAAGDVIEMRMAGQADVEVFATNNFGMAEKLGAGQTSA